MCCKKKILGLCMISLGLGLLIGHLIHSFLLCSLFSLGLAGLGVVLLNSR